MLTYSGALARILGAVPAPRPARVRLAEALGLVLARPVRARVDLPGFDNSAVDGYGLASPAARTHRIVGAASAGRPWRGRLMAGEAARVLTGAQVPQGATAVVMQERVVRRGDVLQTSESTAAGRNIRRRGEDVRRGSVVLAAGTQVGARELGLLAAVGASPVAVWPRPTLSGVVCGDELVPAGLRLRPGRIYESNGPLLKGLAREADVQFAGCAVVRDRMAALTAAIRRGLASDVLVLCGGVSVGDRDFVKAAAAHCGVRKVFWRVSIKPGMPLFFGVHGRTLVFGLPGNPVSVFVTWNELVRPALDRLLGRPGGDRYTTPALLGEPLAVSRGRRTHFVRVTCRLRDGRLVVTPAAAQGSHHLRSLAGAGGWLRVDSKRGPLAAGTPVEIRREAVA